MKKKVPFIAAYWWCMVLFVLGIAVLFLGNHDGGVSETENRSLQGMPKFTFARWFSGEFSSELESYLSDQMPGRDPILKASGRVLGLFDATSEKDRILDQNMIEELEDMNESDASDGSDSVISVDATFGATPQPLPETPAPEQTPSGEDAPTASPAATPVDPAVKDTSVTRRFALKRADGTLSTQFRFGARSRPSSTTTMRRSRTWSLARS